MVSIMLRILNVCVVYFYVVCMWSDQSEFTAPFYGL